ncbi:anti-sigma factor [Nocardia sp. CDC153]|uniref:anti-sigma factor n=1 Tax=Nocardia sp. CDC153 TaxID=3112167 RepID=UPI002DB7E42E|nr:anti-sigma factor [Nocardia sp. CDC153]MEC3957490.1 anti-sigma factor [Nocardia sp. CDC153]
MDRFIDESESAWNSRSGELDVRVPARLEQLSMLRAVTETIMLTADFTIDVVVDVRVALDEVATAMILSAVPGASVDCRFRYDGHQVAVEVSSVLESDGALEGNSFGRSFLETLTDSMDSAAEAFNDALGGYPVVVHLSRLRSEDDDR